MVDTDFLTFIEMSAFSKHRSVLMDDEDFYAFQLYLLEHYEYGDPTSKTGGCRKIRWSRPGMGKSCGIRIIYYIRRLSGRIYLLLIYPKNAQASLSIQEKSILYAISSQLAE